jgi:hypothetical protein
MVRPTVLCLFAGSWVQFPVKSVFIA